MPGLRKWRLRFVLFLVSMCRRWDELHLKPPAVLRNLFAAPLLVFILGIVKISSGSVRISFSLAQASC